MLPKSLIHFPIFFAEEEKSLLKGSNLLKLIEGRINDILIDYDIICKEIPDFSEFPFNEYAEVITIVISRVFKMVYKGKSTEGMVPYADMLNHRSSSSQTVGYYSEEKKGFVIEASVDIAEGEEIFNHYGSKCNSEYFLNYGFLDPENSNGANDLKVEIKL